MRHSVTALLCVCIAAAAGALKYYRGGFGGPTKRDYGRGNVVFGSLASHELRVRAGGETFVQTVTDEGTVSSQLTRTYQGSARGGTESITSVSFSRPGAPVTVYDIAGRAVFRGNPQHLNHLLPGAPTVTRGLYIFNHRASHQRGRLKKYVAY
jgi:hypothetical protein